MILAWWQYQKTYKMYLWSLNLMDPFWNFAVPTSIGFSGLKRLLLPTVVKIWLSLSSTPVAKWKVKNHIVMESQSAWTAITKQPRVGSLNNKSILSWAGRLRSRCQLGWFLVQALSCRLSSLSVLVCPFLCACVWRETDLWSVPLLSTAVYWIDRPHLTFIISFEILSPHTVTLEVRT